MKLGVSFQLTIALGLTACDIMRYTLRVRLGKATDTKRTAIDLQFERRLSLYVLCLALMPLTRRARNGFKL